MEDKIQLYNDHGDILETEDKAIIEISEAKLKQYEFICQNAERYLEVKNKLWQLILKIAKNWVIFGDVGNIGWSDADRIASMLGIGFVNWKRWKSEGEDEKGKYYIHWAQCDAIYNNTTITVFGRCSSRDKFFGKSKGQLRPLYEINEGDIEMASIRTCRKEGVKALLGIANIPIEELKKAGVNVEQADKVEFKKDNKQEDKTQKTPDKIRKEIAEILLKVANNDLLQAQNLLEQISSFVTDDGKVIQGKRKISELSNNQLFVCLGKARKLLENKKGD